MGRDVECTLHRQRGTSKDKVIARATKLELLRHYVNVPPAHRPQYSMWQGDVRYSHLEIQNMAREMGLLKE
jgi:hypothetical protein